VIHTDVAHPSFRLTWCLSTRPETSILRCCFSCKGDLPHRIPYFHSHEALGEKGSNRLEVLLSLLKVELGLSINARLWDAKLNM